jgi:hypothetical protein
VNFEELSSRNRINALTSILVVLELIVILSDLFCFDQADHIPLSVLGCLLFHKNTFPHASSADSPDLFQQKAAEVIEIVICQAQALVCFVGAIHESP